MRDDEILELEDTKPAKKTSKKSQPKGLLARLWNNIFIRNLFYAVVGLLALVLVANFLLLKGTLHGKSSPVPDFSGMTLEEASNVAKQNHLRLEVIDSIYVPQQPRGTVFKQNPEPNIQVKKNRRILITMNTLQPRKVTAPDVVGYSLRQAKAVLASQGLLIGKLSYEPDIATNNVLAQRYKGRTIGSHEQLTVGSEIDLVLGLNADDQRTSVPNTIGLSAEAAKDLLLDYSLNTIFYYDKKIKTYADSAAARIYRQTPSPSSSVIWPLGTKVELFLKEETPTENKN